MQNFSLSQADLSQRLAESTARMEAESLKRKEEKRADRKAGRLSESAYNALRACTIPQLRKAKKLCDEFIWDQKNAPDKQECQESFIVRVLLSVAVRNKRYQFEITRSTKRAEKLYINGPYWYTYWRDGKVVFRRAVKKKNGKLLPRKVKAALKEYLANHDPAQVLKDARARYAMGAGTSA